ncbi:MAG TPA: hypothetical protein PKD90_04405 [Phnomibacter sp.]|nr:hypothetical protein [Phnomibacter sp.]
MEEKYFLKEGEFALAIGMLENLIGLSVQFSKPNEETGLVTLTMEGKVQATAWKGGSEIFGSQLIIPTEKPLYESSADTQAYLQASWQSSTQKGVLGVTASIMGDKKTHGKKTHGAD